MSNVCSPVASRSASYGHQYACPLAALVRSRDESAFLRNAVEHGCPSGVRDASSRFNRKWLPGSMRWTAACVATATEHPPSTDAFL